MLGTDLYLRIPSEQLIFLCGADPGTGTAVDLGRIIKTYLMGDQEKRREREAMMGRFLCACLVAQLEK